MNGKGAIRAGRANIDWLLSGYFAIIAGKSKRLLTGIYCSARIVFIEEKKTGITGGFARRYNKDGSLFDVPRQAVNSLRRQSKKEDFKNIKFIHIDFRELPKHKIKDFVIYCDPPYRGTTKYKADDFPYEEFYQWCRDMSKDNIVLISEYNMPNDFECIWEKQHKTSLGSGVNGKNDKNRVEKLFIHKK